MGVSTDAILVYGVPLAEGEIDEYEDVDGNEDRSSPSYMVFMGEVIDGISIVTHCSDIDRMHIVAVAGTERRAWRGRPRVIDHTSIVVDRSWDAKLRTFINERQLKVDGQPGWYLCSWWG